MCALATRDDAVDWGMLLRFLPVFERPGFTPGHWEVPPGSDLGFFSYSDEVQAFERAAYDARVVYEFDWPRWNLRRGTRLVRDRDALARARLPTLRKLLMTHLRAERFCEGHLADVLASGHLVALLRRVEHLTSRSTPPAG